jgi:hypothetical protein
MVKRNRALSALCIGCTMLLSIQSWAAILEPGLGDLTINQRAGFKPVTSRVNAKVGDSVMVGPGGAATVVYEDGCKVNVRPGSVVNVAPLSPCAAGSYAADMAVKAPPPVESPVAAPVWGWSNWLFAGLAVATGVVIGVGASKQSQSGQGQPASP